jgi:hypothetical protein
MRGLIKSRSQNLSDSCLILDAERQGFRQGIEQEQGQCSVPYLSLGGLHLTTSNLSLIKDKLSPKFSALKKFEILLIR